jgi:hypothetical protein
MFNNEDFQGVVEDVVIPIEEIVVEEIAEEAEAVEVPVEEPVIEEVAVEEPEAKKDPKKVSKKKEEPEMPGMVAVFSTRSVTGEGIGKVQRGYNILTAEQAEKWLKRTHVRLATPEEVKEAFKG